MGGNAMSRGSAARRSARSAAVIAVLAALLEEGCAKLPKKPRSTATAPLTAAQIAELWVEPADIRARDLFHGPGGPALAPAAGSRFQFLKKDTKGYSWGWDVKDANGMEWSAKYGPEAHSEVVASRLVWAIGFHQPPTYFVERWEMQGGDGGPKPPSRFRPDLPGRRRAGEWSWRANPFVGTEPFRGLLVLMRILNNWDLLDRNTAIYDLDAPLEGARRWYVVIDLGASLGRTKIVPVSGTRNDIEDFEQQGFIKGVNDKGFVEFDDLGRFHRELFSELTPADVRWTCERLDRLDAKQWQDAFRAAGYKDEEAARFIRKIREKVAAGLALAPSR
jgi:hypothetical protein